VPHRPAAAYGSRRLGRDDAEGVARPEPAVDSSEGPHPLLGRALNRLPALALEAASQLLQAPARELTIVDGRVIRAGMPSGPLA
jgi:hypothetical protein